MKVEVEGGELALRNNFGDIAIIPKDKRVEAEKYIKEGCYGCLDALIAGLPNLGKLAENGGVLPEEELEGEQSNVNPPDLESMSKVLSQKYKHLNWVERGLNPENFPSITNEDGTFSTHRLAYDTDDSGNAYIYPTIIQNDKGELIELDIDAAFEYAKNSNTLMKVPNIKLAEYYSKQGLIKH